MGDGDGFRLEDARVALIGLGLMGGSLAMTLKEKCRRLEAVEPDAAIRELARRRGVVDSIEADPAQILSEADLVILAAPIPAILDWLKELPRYIKKPCVVLDLGSSKRVVATAMEKLPANFDPIGGHPICGRERLSLENADPGLYRGAAFVLTPLRRTGERARAAARQVIEVLGAREMELDAEEHDRILAATSHLPFLLSSALALSTPAEFADFIGTGFRSASRLAGTPSSMMSGVIQSNRQNILQAFDRFQSGLDALKAAIQDNNEEQLNRLLGDACSQYQKLITEQ